MKKKSANKSKDRDKAAKLDDTKTHKHSRRRRKSSSSESGNNDSDAVNETPEEVKTRRTNAAPKKEVVATAAAATTATAAVVENSVAAASVAAASVAGGRVTRHSRRLAAISGSVDSTEETNEVSSPVKTGKSSPYSVAECKASPSKVTRISLCFLRASTKNRAL